MGNTNGRQSGNSSPRHQSNTSSQPHLARTFDGGSLSPHGIYPGHPDYNPNHVLKYIRERRLAPFYKGLDDYEEEWTDYQLAFMVREGKLPPTPEPPSPVTWSSTSRPPSNSSTPSLLLPPSVDEHGNLSPMSPRLRGMSVIESSSDPNLHLQPTTTSLSSISRDKRTRPRAQTIGSSTIVPTRGKPLEAVVYRGAIECPVCFLFYPPNINRTRCCWKPICTECFVEMKRSEPHYPTNDDNPDSPTPTPSNLNLNPMNLISDPVRCPFCVKSEFGVVYNPPLWLPQDPRQTPSHHPEIATSPLHSDTDLPLAKREEMYPPGHQRVVLSDNIRPDWYQALAHRRRVEARRLATATALQQALAVAGQRRRSVGGRVQTGGIAAGMGTGGVVAGQERRVGRRVDGMIRITRDEADEMMLQEAIRQSLMTEEEERRKRDDEERKKAGNTEGAEVVGGEISVTGGAPRASMSSSSSPVTPSVLPRLQPSISTSPPSPRSFFSALRSRSGSHSSRNGSSPPNTTPNQPSPRPNSMHNLSPPPQIVRRQPSLPEMPTSTSLATAMHDSIVPGLDDTRPSISSPLAHNVSMSSTQHESSSEDHDESPQAASLSTESTIDEIVAVPVTNVPEERNSGLKSRTSAGSVEEREVVEVSN